MLQHCLPSCAVLLTASFLMADPLYAQEPAKRPQASTLTPTPMKAARDEFLRQNHWVDARGQWQAFKVAPRNVDAMTGDQWRHESAQLTRTHQWDEANQRWLPRERQPAVKLAVQARP